MKPCCSLAQKIAHRTLKICLAFPNDFTHHQIQRKKSELSELKQTKVMKKLLIAVLLGGLILRQSAWSQTNTAEAGQVPPTESATTPSAAAESNAPATNVTGNETAPATEAAAATNAPAATTAEPLAGPATNVPAPPVASIPLIQFQDVPLTTAIENLARQAGINYLLDPKIGYGQPDQNGQIKAEPTLSIRWENVTAEQALLALLDNYGLQLVEDKKTHIARITTKDPTAPPALITRVIQLKYSSVSNMTVAVQSVFADKRSRVLADTRTSQLVVVATDPEQSAVDTLVAQLDKPTRQVLIETRLVEISSNPQTSKGIDWAGTLAAQNVAFGNNLNASPTTLSPGYWGYLAGQAVTNGQPPVLGINQELGNLVNKPSVAANTAAGFGSLGFLNADGVSAVISFLNQSYNAQQLSLPRVVTLDNTPARISVVRGYPVINVTAGTVQTAGGSSIGYTNVGTVLEVTPRISANDYIWLKVVPEVSSFFSVMKMIVGGAEFDADVFDFRKIETQVVIPNSSTLVMGGLVTDSPTSTYTKVPLLGDIPLLGYAFRSESKSTAKENLLLFITPTIIKDDDFQPATSDFLRTKPPQPKSPVNPNSLWEGARPFDWSNPQNTDPDQKWIDQKY
jgi:type II secretory pathway component GspD/PulD (secretin)